MPRLLAALLLAPLLTAGCLDAPSAERPAADRGTVASRGNGDLGYDDDLSRNEDFGGDEDLGAIPPAGTSGDAAASDWSPGQSTVDEVEPEPVPAPEIDLVALENAEPLPGSEFNKFFPTQGGEWDIVFKQEKEGFAAASLQTGGEEVALLTIADLAGNATAADKFRDATNAVDGYPLTKSGSKGTVVLVGGRFQVQVRSADGSMDVAERTRWLRKFNLDGIAGLAK